MKLLLDTHVFLWWRANDRRLGPAARAAVADAEVVFVSAATAWEAAIKAALGRLRYPDTIEAGVEASGFEKLAITLAHATTRTQQEAVLATLKKSLILWLRFRDGIARACGLKKS